MKKLFPLILALLLVCCIPLAAFADGEEPPYSLPNGDFETGDLTGWTPLTAGWGADETGKYTGVIGDATYWNEEMPYNQGGSYHLDGWNTGIDERQTWQLKSSVFTLGGSGFITLRMGGKAAAVRVYTAADDTLIAYYKQTRFKDANFPHVGEEGGSWADMGTYIIDLSEHLGKQLYIVLCDEKTDTWAHAFFDEVITYYETAPNADDLVDMVKDGGSDEQVAIKAVVAENRLEEALAADAAAKAAAAYVPPAPVDTFYVPEAANEYSIINGNFETGTLAGWTAVSGSFGQDSFGHLTGVIGDATYWGEQMPYN